jgi:hypothetical protein
MRVRSGSSLPCPRKKYPEIDTFKVGLFLIRSDL